MSQIVKEYRTLDQDIALSANSDYHIASQKAVKTYVDNEVDHVKGAIDWRIQDYTVTSETNVLTITLERPCYFHEGLFAFFNGKTLIPDSCISIAQDKTTLTITSTSNFQVGDLIQLRWAYLHTISTVEGYIQLPEGILNEDVDYVIDYGTTNGVWYRLYKSGWLEQGGTQTGTGAYGLATVTLAKEYANTNYSVQAAIQWPATDNLSWYTDDTAIPSGAGVTDVAGVPCDKTATSFKLQSYSTHTWTTSGQAKSS